MLVFLLALVSPDAGFSCVVTKVHDGDGPLWCSSGIKVRIAGVQAPDFEDTEPCRMSKAEYVCSDDAATRSRKLVKRIALHRRLTCTAVGQSYNRVVARCVLPNGRDLACTTIAIGAAVRWDTYWKRYRLKPCR